MQDHQSRADSLPESQRGTQAAPPRRVPLSLPIVLAVSVALVIAISLTVASALQFQRERKNFDDTSLRVATSFLDNVAPVATQALQGPFPGALSGFFSQLGGQPPIVAVRVVGFDGEVVATGGSAERLGEITPVINTLKVSDLHVLRDGQYVQVSRMIKLDDGSELAMQVVVTTEQFESLESDLPNIIWQGVLLALGGAFIAAILARYITSPLLKLANAARRIADGDLSFSTATTRPDEIGTLSNAFDDMRLRLAEAGSRITSGQRQLEAANEDLAAAEAEARRHAEVSRVLARISRLVTAAAELGVMYETLTRMINEIVPHDRAVIYRIDADRRELTFDYISGVEVPNGSVGDTLNLSDTMLEKVFEANGPVRFELEGNTDLDSELLTGPAADHGVKSLIAAPFFSEGRIIGAISLASTSDNAFSESSLARLDQIAGQVGGAIGAARLGEQLREESEKRIQDLEELDHLRVQFIQMVTHEFRTPLSSIRISRDLLSEAPPTDLSDDSYQRLIQNMGRGVDRLDTLVSDILDLTTARSGDLNLNIESANIAEIVTDASSIVTPLAAERNQEMSLEIQDNIPSIQLDRQRIEQVVINLLSNAQKYSPDNSQINTRVHVVDGQIRVEVAGQGEPIAEEDRAHLFEPFFRGSDPNVQQTPGRGLGLAVARALIELHNGQIGYDPEGTLGSTFYFTLPTN